MDIKQLNEDEVILVFNGLKIRICEEEAKRLAEEIEDYYSCEDCEEE